MSDYAAIAQQLGQVRWAWKRTAMLSGLSLVLVELVGVFSVALLVDVLYRPSTPGRVALLAGVLVVLGFLLARHVFRPLLRRIPDEQIALYVEEHNPGFEGALVTAAEFRTAESLPVEQRGIIDAIVREAVRRSAEFDLRKVIDLRRLKKYAFAACFLVLGYLLLGALFPDTIGYHALRIATPWFADADEGLDAGARHRADALAAFQQPIQFSLSREDASVARGAPFSLDATLSRFPDQTVLFHFRPRQAEGEAKWMELPMQEVEKLNTYHLELPDVNEPLEFYVSSGDHRSKACRLDVYELLAVRGLEIRVQYPAYLKLEDMVEPQASGDIAAPIGSKVTVRVAANNPLREGQLRWVNKPSQALKVETGDQAVVAATFEVQADAQYEFTIHDVHGQEARSQAPFNVRALQDNPPTLEVFFPKIDLVIHPLAEVTAIAEATDDLALETVDLVYSLGRTDSPEVHVPLKLQAKSGPRKPPFRDVRGELVLEMETFKPHLVPGDTLTYYLEARDAKGQKATSDMYVLSMMHFETWGTIKVMAPEDHAPELEPPPLAGYLAAAWHLHLQKEQLKPDVFNTQSEELGHSMEDPGTKKPFIYGKPPKGVVYTPEQQAHMDACNKYVQEAYDKLLTPHDAFGAVRALRLAIFELTQIGLSEFAVVKMGGGGSGGAIPLKEETLTQIQMSVEKHEMQSQGQNIVLPVVGPGYRREMRKAEEAQKLKEQAKDLKDDLKELIAQTQEVAQQNPANQQPQGEQKGEPKDQAKAENQGQPEAAQKGEAKAEANAAQKPAAHDAGNPPDAKELAKGHENAAQRAKDLAEQAGKLADANAEFRNAANELNAAAAELFRAANNAQHGEMQNAAQNANRANQELDKAIAELDKLHQTNLERALDKLETTMQRVHNEEQMLRRQTEGIVAKQDAGGPLDPDQKRDLRSLPLRQAQNRMDAEAATKEIEKQLEAAKNSGRTDIARNLEAAKQAGQRGQAVQRMENAVVALNEGDTKGAVEQEKQAENAVRKMLNAVKAANDGLASDLDSELRRAAHEGQAIAEDLNRLAGQPEAQGTEKGEAKGAEKGEAKGTEKGEAKGTEKGEAKGTEKGEAKGTEKGEAKGTEKGEAKGTEKGEAKGTEKGEAKGTEKGEAKGTEKGEAKGAEKGEAKGTEKGEAAAHHEPGEGQGRPLSQRERKELGENLAYDLQRFARHLNNRNFADPDDTNRIQNAAQTPEELGQQAAENPAKLEALRSVVARATDKVEKEIQARLEAKRLFSAKREEVPPQYRQLVNQYYEALGKTRQ